MKKHIRKGAAAAVAVGTIGVAGIVIAHAAKSPSTINALAAAATASPGTQPQGHPGRFGGSPADRTEDDQVIATAIGISTTQLQTELQGGKTIAQVAQTHGVAVDKVVSAMVAAETKEIDQRVTAGQETQAQATQEKANLQQRVTDEVNGTGHGPGGPGRHGGMQAEDQQLVAAAIGITTAQLQTELQSGKTIAQVAQAHGVSVDAVISKWVASENQEIDQRLAAGQVTQAQADQMKTATQQRVTDEVNGTHPAMPAGGRPGGPPPSGY